MINLYNQDCLDIYKNINQSSVDLILCDPPYGTIQGLKLNWKEKITWDQTINPNDFFMMSNYLLRMNGKMILFSQEPYTSYLIQNTNQNMLFCYRMIWEKNHFANSFTCKKAPLNYYEDIIIFQKKYDSLFDHPLRSYSKKIYTYINKSKKEINNILGHQKTDHFFRFSSTQFDLCTKEVYEQMIDVFSIDQMDDFMEYKECEKIHSTFKSTFKSTFNLSKNKKYKSNILKYKKDQNNIHPTQKPIALLEDLIFTYSNENDLILDNCMGSGSTGIAACNLKRRFIGIEKDKDIFEAASKRLKEHQRQLKLF